MILQEIEEMRERAKVEIGPYAKLRLGYLVRLAKCYGIPESEIEAARTGHRFAPGTEIKYGC